MSRSVALMSALGLAAALAVPRPAAADEARVLDDTGRLLTVGNWSTQMLDGGGTLRVPDAHVLSWEMRDGSTLVAEGLVPGTEDDRADATPALSRNPVNGEILLAWSRLDATGHRDLVTGSFSANAWKPGSVRVLAGSDSNELDPVLVHDVKGNACIAWRTMDVEQGVTVLTMDPSGNVLTTRKISEGISVRNGAPRLGVDAAGGLYVAFFGIDVASGTGRLLVMSVLDQGGGTIHLPEPILEFGLRASIPAPMAAGDFLSGNLPAIHLTTLGGTPLAWWTSLEDERLVLNYLAQGSTGYWAENPVGRIDLGSASSAGEQDIREALNLLEARVRRITTTIGGGIGGPLPIVRPTLPRRW